jgi:hypothetical protein
MKPFENMRDSAHRQTDAVLGLAQQRVPSRSRNPALIAGNRANIGAINENGNGRFAGATDTIGACDIPLVI